jgi:hypothetical protein
VAYSFPAASTALRIAAGRRQQLTPLAGGADDPAEVGRLPPSDFRGADRPSGLACGSGISVVRQWLPGDSRDALDWRCRSRGRSGSRAPRRWCNGCGWRPGRRVQVPVGVWVGRRRSRRRGSPADRDRQGGCRHHADKHRSHLGTPSRCVSGVRPSVSSVTSQGSVVLPARMWFSICQRHPVAARPRRLHSAAVQPRRSSASMRRS